MLRVIALILLMFLLNGCDIECVYPGDGINANSSRIGVPAYIEGMDPDKVETLWVDTGVTIEGDKETVISVSGEIDLCGKVFSPSGYEECPELNCSIVEVSNLFCSDNSPSPGIYNPSDLKDPKNKKPLCDVSSVDANGYYVDSNLELSPGEKVMFEPLPVIEVNAANFNCDHINEGFTWYTDDDFKDVKGKDIPSKSGKKLDPQSVCKSGAELEVKRGKTDVIPLKIPPAASEGVKYSAIVSNGYTPRGNKVIVGDSTSKWIDAAEVDMRFFIPSILSDESFCKVTYEPHGDLNPSELEKQMSPEYKYFDKDKGCIEKNIPQLKRFNAYKVNLMCGRLNSNGSYGDGIYSIRYDETVDTRDICFRGRRREEGSGVERAWADLLVAKLGNTSSPREALQNFSDEAQQCIYSTADGPNTAGSVTKCMDIDQYSGGIPSLKLYEWYTAPSNISSGSPLLLGIAGRSGSYDKNIYSGYRIRVRKSCSHQDGERLYLYIGDTPPTVAPGPGQPNVHSLHFKAGTKKRAVINPDSLDPGTYSISFKGSGRIYLGIHQASTSSIVAAIKKGKYLAKEDNKYTVEITREEWYPNFSGPFQKIYHVVMRLFYGKSDITTGLPASDGLIVQIYKLVAERLAPSVQPFIALYIVVYGLSFLLGIIRDPRSDVVMRVAKIAFIALLVSEHSWHFFGETIFNLFINSSNELIYYFTGNLSGKYTPDNTFEFLDRTAGVILTNQFWLRMLALLLAGPAGWLVMAVIIWGVFLFFSCIVEAMVVYLMILIATGLLFLLAPLFISFLLFQRTKPLFEGWLKMLISFALRPIFIFGTLALLNAIMMAALYGINNFGVCPGCVLSTNIFGDELCIVRGIVPLGFDAEVQIEDRASFVSGTPNTEFMGLPVSFIAVLVFLIVAHVMKSFLKITDSMVDMITNTMMGYTGSIGGGSPSDAGHRAYQTMLSVFGMDDATQSEIKRALGSRARSKRSIELKAEEGEEIEKNNNKASGSKNPDDALRKDLEEKPGITLEAVKEDGKMDNLPYQSGLAKAMQDGAAITRDENSQESRKEMVENPIYKSSESTIGRSEVSSKEGDVETRESTSQETGEKMVDDPIYQSSGSTTGGSEASPKEGDVETRESTSQETGEKMVDDPIYQSSGSTTGGSEASPKEGDVETQASTSQETGEKMVENPIYQSSEESSVHGTGSSAPRGGEGPQDNAQENKSGEDEGE